MAPGRSDQASWRSGSGQGPKSVAGSKQSTQSIGISGATASGKINGDKDEVKSGKGPAVTPLQSPPPSRFSFLSLSLVGQTVEVTIKNGCTYTGIFHTANESDFGVVIKMARLTKDFTNPKSIAVKDAARKPPMKTFTVHGKDLLQVLAKEVLLGTDDLQNGRSRDQKGDIITDSSISKGRLLSEERVLKPWRPEAGDEAPRNMWLDGTFSTQRVSSRNWDQFKVNEEMYGVKSTYAEELYTTKLERPSRDIEREASRIAREIESQGSKNVHQAEERGQKLAPDIESMDEETRFSSVIRSRDKTDTGEDGEDRNIDTCNDKTFGAASSSPAEKRAGPPGIAALPQPESTQESGEEGDKKEGQSVQVRRIGGQPASFGTIPEKVPPSAASVKEGGYSMEDADVLQKEHLRLRLHPKRSTKASGGSSPYHSPAGRRSPLISPLVGDGASIQALNLDPSCPQVDKQVYKDLYEFKEQAKKSGKKHREDAVNELRSFSESLKERTVSPRAVEPRSPLARGSGTDTPPPTSSSRLMHAELASRHSTSPPLSPPPPTPSTSKVTGTLQPARMKFLSGASAPDSQAPSQDIPDGAPSTVPGASVQGTEQSQSADTLSLIALKGPSSTASVSSTSSAAAVASPKKSSLNPNAKEFKLNPNAKAFTPGTPVSTPASGASPHARPIGITPVFLPGVVQLPGVVGTPFMPGIPGQQFQHYNAMAAYMQQAGPPGTMFSLPSGQPGLKLPSPSPQQQQQQIMPPIYGQQTPIRGFPPQGPPMQGFMYPGGQQLAYPPSPSIMYMQPVPQMMQPLGPQQQQQQQSQQQQQQLQQTPIANVPPQGGQQQQKHRGAMPIQYPGGGPPFIAGQQHSMPHSHGHPMNMPGQMQPPLGGGRSSSSGGGPGNRSSSKQGGPS